MMMAGLVRPGAVTEGPWGGVRFPFTVWAVHDIPGRGRFPVDGGSFLGWLAGRAWMSSGLGVVA